VFHQYLFFQENYPEFAAELAGSHWATINLSFEEKLKPNSWEYHFPEVAWLPGCPDWSEPISFLPLRLSCNGLTFKAWLYKPHNSPHRHNEHLWEVIAPFINDLACNTQCTVEINGKYVS
jgi:hypothetical protein